MRIRKPLRLLALGAGLALVAAGPPPVAGAAPAFPFVYDARFLCTANHPGTSESTPSVLPGSYQSVIGVHNPNPRRAHLRLRLALTFPAVALEPGPVSVARLVELPAGEALQIDCDAITGGGFEILPIHGAEGFVVVESTRSVAVTATHTAGSAEVAGISTEEVRERVRE